MPAKRMTPLSDAANQVAEIKRTQRTPEENTERAYIAASRRTDRPIVDRITSAQKASECHKQRTGKRLKITEEAVLGEQQYESEDDEDPGNGEFGNISANNMSTTNSAARKAEHYKRTAERYEEMARVFEGTYPGLLPRPTVPSRQPYNHFRPSILGTYPWLQRPWPAYATATGRTSSMPQLFFPNAALYPGQDAGDGASAAVASMSGGWVPMRSYSLPDAMDSSQLPSPYSSMAAGTVPTGTESHDPFFGLSMAAVSADTGTDSSDSLFDPWTATRSESTETDPDDLLLDPWMAAETDGRGAGSISDFSQFIDLDGSNGSEA